ncbi:hypothetical protein D3C86_1729150 [compost metagenome]
MFSVNNGKRKTLQQNQKPPDKQSQKYFVETNFPHLFFLKIEMQKSTAQFPQKQIDRKDSKKDCCLPNLVF